MKTRQLKELYVCLLTDVISASFTIGRYSPSPLWENGSRLKQGESHFLALKTIAGFLIKCIDKNVLGARLFYLYSVLQMWREAGEVPGSAAAREQGTSAEIQGPHNS